MRFDATPQSRQVRPLTGRAVLMTLLAFFSVVIGVNTVMAVLAIDTMPGVEVASPYREGLRFNAEIAAAQAQAARDWNVTAELARRAGDTASLRIAARDREGAPLIGLSVSARLERPTTTRADHAVDLGEGESGIYRATIAGMEPGQWDLVIAASRGGARLFLSRNRIVLP